MTNKILDPRRGVAAIGPAGLALLLATVSTAASPAFGVDVCPAGDPCVVSQLVEVPPGSVIDVGSRQLIITPSGRISPQAGTGTGAGSMTIRAGRVTVQQGGELRARGNPVLEGGAMRVEAGEITLAGKIDVSGAPGGNLTLVSTGPLSVSGTIDATSRIDDESGGAIELSGTAVDLGGTISAAGGRTDTGGDITVTATALNLSGKLDASGGDGGSIDLSSDGIVNLFASGSLLADANQSSGSGGEIDVAAGDDATLNGVVSAVGKAAAVDDIGGDGGAITMEAAGSYRSTAAGARLIATGGTPEGSGGDVDLSTDADVISLPRQIDVHASGGDADGGTISVDAAGAATFTWTMDVRGDGGGGGDIDLSADGGSMVVGSGALLDASAGSDGSGGDISLFAGSQLQVQGKLDSDGGSADGSTGGSSQLTACVVRVDSSALLTSLKPAGINTLIGRDQTVVRGTLRADATTGRNEIRFAGPDYQPSLAGATITPAALLLFDARVIPCNPVDTRTPTRTATPGPPASPSATPTLTRTPGSACPGDCNGDGQVTIDELIKGVNIALGQQPLAACPAFDRGGDGQVTIDDLIAAVNAALTGCPP